MTRWTARTVLLAASLAATVGGWAVLAGEVARGGPAGGETEPMVIAQPVPTLVERPSQTVGSVVAPPAPARAAVAAAPSQLPRPIARTRSSR